MEWEEKRRGIYGVHCFSQTFNSDPWFTVKIIWSIRRIGMETQSDSCCLEILPSKLETQIKFLLLTILRHTLYHRLLDGEISASCIIVLGKDIEITWAINRNLNLNRWRKMVIFWWQEKVLISNPYILGTLIILNKRLNHLGNVGRYLPYFVLFLALLSASLY